MQARIKQDSRYATLRLFFGREYSKTEWSPIPEGFEEQAEQSEFLDTRPDAVPGEAPAKASRGKATIPAAPIGTHPAVETENVVEVSNGETPVPAADAPSDPEPDFETAPKHTPSNRNRHGRGK